MTPINRMATSAATSAAAISSRQRISGRSIALAVAATGLCSTGTCWLVVVSIGQVNGPLISSSIAQPSGPIFSFHSL